MDIKELKAITLNAMTGRQLRTVLNNLPDEDLDKPLVVHTYIPMKKYPITQVLTTQDEIWIETTTQ